MSETDWRSTVEAAARGDEAARDELVRNYADRVRSRVHAELEQDFRRNHRWILPLFSTRDVVQDVFVAVIRSLSSNAEDLDFPGEPAFIAWLSTVVRNRLLDAVRHHEASRRDVRRAVQDADGELAARQPDDDRGAPELAAELAEHAAILGEVLESLPERQRDLITMRIVDGEKFAVLAEKLGYSSEESVRQSFHRAQAKLLVKLRAKGLRPPGETLG